MRIGTIIKLVLGLALVGLIVVIGLIASLDVNKYKSVVQAQVKQATGRTLSIDGDLTLALSLSPAVVATKVSFSNAPWGSRPQMASVERIEAEIALIPALTGNIEIKRLVLVKPDILLETRKDGADNWTMTSEPAPAKPTTGTASALSPESGAVADTSSSSGPSRLPVLQSVRIEEGRLIYKPAGGDPLTLGVARMTAAASDAKSPISFETTGTYNTVAFDLSGKIGALAALMAGSAPYPVDVKGTFAGIRLQADGTITDPKGAATLDLKTSIKADHYDDLRKIATIPALPPLAFSGRVTGGGMVYAVNDADLTLGKSRVSGRVKVATGGARPKLDVALRSPLLDLGELFPEAKEEAAKPASDKAKGTGTASAPAKGGAGTEKVFSRDPLPWSSLKAADGTADIEIEKLVLPDGLAFEGVAVKGSLSNGRLALSPISAKLGDGVVKITADIDASSGQTAAIKADGVADKVLLGKLFQQLGKPNMVSAVPTDAKISVSANGASVAALMATLDGSVLIKMGEGKVHNSLIDWMGADVIRQLADRLSADNDPQTKLTCGVVNLKARKGVASWDRQVAFQTTKMNLASSGNVDLGQEVLDVGVKPSTREGVGLGAGKLAEMLRLTGPLGNPALGIDAQSVARNVLSIAGAMATGGASLLAEGLLDSSTKDANPCATALLETPPPVQKGGKAPSGDKKEKPSKTLRRELKGLFGQ